MFKHASESQVVITQLMLPSHSNFSGKIHGGFILGLMDQIAFACASKHSRHYCVTASVNKVDFLNSQLKIKKNRSLKILIIFKVNM